MDRKGSSDTEPGSFQSVVVHLNMACITIETACNVVSIRHGGMCAPLQGIVGLRAKAGRHTSHSRSLLRVIVHSIIQQRETPRQAITLSETTTDMCSASHLCPRQALLERAVDVGCV